MGTSLTGLTPSTTYDALIKVGDNGALSATAKYLSDGLGNDSTLALSTTKVGIGTASPSSLLHVSQASANTILRIGNNASFDQFIYFNGNNDWSLGIDNSNSNAFVLANASSVGTNDRVVVTTAGNVGIGTATPDGKLDVSSVGNLVSTGVWTNPHISLTTPSSLTDNDSFVGITYATSDNSAGFGWSMGAVRTTAGSGNLEIRKHSSSVLGTQIATFTADGLTFNGDTAAANALDDYEEGTFTATISGGTFTSLNTGVYTKIGRQVYWYLSPTTTAITGNLTISGLPFTNADRSASLFATVPPTGVTYLPAFHNSSSASCDINVSGTYSGGAVSSYFAGVYSV